MPCACVFVDSFCHHVPFQNVFDVSKVLWRTGMPEPPETLPPHFVEQWTRARLETALTAAVQASLPVPTTERLVFIGSHLKAQADGRAPPTAAAPSTATRPSAGELNELAAALSKVLNDARHAPGWPLRAVANALLGTDGRCEEEDDDLLLAVPLPKPPLKLNRTETRNFARELAAAIIESTSAESSASNGLDATASEPSATTWTTIEAVVPDGCVPGEEFTVEWEGSELIVMVPEDGYAGMLLEIDVGPPSGLGVPATCEEVAEMGFSEMGFSEIVPEDSTGAADKSTSTAAASEATRGHALSRSFTLIERYSTPHPLKRSYTTAAMSQVDRYFAVESLLETVESGAISPISGRWLVNLRQSGGRIERRQDLPPEAFLTAPTLRRLASALGSDFGLLFVVLSYKWLATWHCDPDRFHLDAVADVAQTYLLPNFEAERSLISRSPLTAAFEGAGLTEPPDFGLFWDFASLFQPPRTLPEELLFVRGLRDSTDLWCGHAHTVVWMQSAVPGGFSGATYDASGFCFCEAATSAVVKSHARRLDIGRRTPDATAAGTLGARGGASAACAPGGTERAVSGDERTGRDASAAYAGGYWKPSRRLEHVCSTHRPPPLLPDAADALFREAKAFSDPADAAVVSRVYRTFFGAVSVSATSLSFSTLSWTAAEATALSAALPHFTALTSLDVAHNPIGPEGAVALATALEELPRLRTLDLSETSMGAVGVEVIARALETTPSLTELNLSMCVEDASLADGPAVATALAAALAHCSSLTCLRLSSNNLGDGESGYLPASAVEGGPIEVGARVAHLGRAVVVTHWDGTEVKVCPLAPDLSGLDALARAMLASRSLTSIDLAENQIGSGGAALLAECLRQACDEASQAAAEAGASSRAAAEAGASSRAPPLRLRRVDVRENYLVEARAPDAHGLLRTTHDEQAVAALRDAGEAARLELLI